MKTYELFAGIGAPHEAIRQYKLPYKIVGACEKDKYARAIYRYRFKPEFEVDKDVKGFLPKVKFNCLIFGWPCQDNSIAGNRKGQKEGTRSGLLSEAVRILRIKKPEYFIAENVPGLFSVNEGYDFYESIRMLTDVGYDCQWQILNTRWFRPQNRARIYFVGHFRGKPRPQVFPVTEDDKYLIETQRQGKKKRTRIRNHKSQYISSLRAAGVNDDMSTLIKRVDENAPHYQDRIYSDDGISPTLPTGSGGNHTPFIKTKRVAGWVETDKRIFAYQKDKKRSTVQELIFHKPFDQIDAITTGHIPKLINPQLWVMGKTKPGRTCLCASRTLEVGDKYGSIRRLTPIEVERLQGFPDLFTAKGIDDSGNGISISDTQRYRTCGNAMSVPVIGLILKRLIQT